MKVAGAVRTREPLVPVIVTVKASSIVEVQDRVAVAGDGGSVTLGGVMAPQVLPAGTVDARVTVPVKPFKPVTVMVEVRVPGAPDGEVAATVKSVTWKSIAAVVFDLELLVPVTVTV